MYEPTYGEIEDFKKELLNKKIIDWNYDELVLSDGTIVSIECSEQACCATAGGSFSDVKLDAMITDVSFSEVASLRHIDTMVSAVVVTIFHNNNIIAKANMSADTGQLDGYYSIASFVVKGIHYPVVES